MDEDGNSVNNGGNTPPGLNRREKAEKPENPNKPEKPENPGEEDSSDKKANKAQQGTHIYTYDELNRMVTSDISKVESTYTYDTLGNLIYEKEKNVKTDYQYNELNQLVYRKQDNESYTYSYDKRGNRIAETSKKETREYIYDETNHLVEGTNWKDDKSAYTYNGLDVRINNTQTAHSGSVYSRDYVIDYTSLERDDLMVFAEGDGQLDYVQREVYAGSERIEQFTDRSNGGYERLLYVHEDLMGNTRYYTKANGQSYAELTYDAWGMPESPNKLLNNDHGNYVYATYTGHIFDTTLDIYFAEARFYDANTRTWLAMDPIKDGDNWYQYCYNNPLKYWDPLGLWVEVNAESGFTKFSGSDNTVHYLLNIDGAKTFGHAAMLIVNQEGEGLFYSYMASDSLWKVIGGVKSKSVMAELYGTAEDVQNLLRTGNVNFTTDTYIVDDNYDRTISKGVNFNDVIELLGVANSFKGKPYDTYNNNCGTFVMDALSKIDSTMRNEERYSFPNVQYVNMINSIQETWDISSIGSDTTKESIVLRTYIGTYINKTVRSLSMPMLNLHY